MKQDESLHQTILEDLTKLLNIAKLNVDAFAWVGLIESATELKKAYKKQIPKKPYHDMSDERTLLKCPGCNYIFVTKYADGSLCAGRMSKYCPDCGEKLDWGKE